MTNRGSAQQLQQDDLQVLNVEVNVAFTPEGKLCCSYTGDIQGEEILVVSEHAEITLKLRSSLGVAFASNPITWFAPEQSGKVEALKPACFAVSRDSDQQVTIRDWNNEASYGSYRFTINVIHEKKRHVLDPTIVNVQPSTSPPPPPPPS